MSISVRNPELFPPHTAAVFDLDGTLLDSMWVWLAVDRLFFAQRGLPLPEDYAREIQPLTFRETAEYTIQRFGLGEAPEEVMAEWNEMSYAQYRDHVKLKPGAKAYLERLHAKGVRIGTATNLSRRFMEAVLQQNGVLQLFHALTSSDEAPRGKRHPDVYFLAAQKLGVSPGQCVAFDDVADSLLGIRAAGMTACAVQEPSFPQDWDAMLRLSDVHITGFEDLP